MSSADPTGSSARTTWRPAEWASPCRRSATPATRTPSSPPRPTVGSSPRRHGPKIPAGPSRRRSASSTPPRGSLLFAPIVITGGVNSATFSADGSRLAMTIEERDARLVLIDAHTGSEMATVPGDLFTDEDEYPLTGAVTVGDTFVVGSGGATAGSVRVFDAATLELRSTIAATPDFVNYLHAVGDTTVIATGRDGQTRIDVADRRDRLGAPR